MAILKDGFSTIITISGDPDIEFEEKTLTPPSIEGGGENDASTMRNTAWRTKYPKGLKTLGPMQCNVAYDPLVYTSIIAQLNVNQSITVTFPNGGTLQFYGWIDAFTPDAAEEGSQPTATVAIIPSNINPTGEVEAAPVYTAPSA